MTEKSLSELVQQAEQLTCHMDEGVEELPRVDRSLTQILHSAQNIFPSSSSVPAGNHDAQASILLGSRGLDLLHMSHRLEALNASRTLEPLIPAPDTDIVAFLKNERQNAIISSIEDTRRQTHTEVENLFWEQQKSEWEQAKQKFMGTFANIHADALNIMPLTQESLSSQLSFSNKGASMSHEETLYAKVVVDYNTGVLQGGIHPNLSTVLSKSMNSIDDQNIADLWSMICSIVEVPLKLGQEISCRTSPRVQTALINQSRKHLEKSYEKHMRSFVSAHLERANLGGIPGLVPLVKAYLSVVLPPQSLAHLEDGEAKGCPVWPLIFYCLRSGGPKAAASVVQENNNPSVLEIIPALEELQRNDNVRIQSDMEKKLKLSYKRNSKNMTDPFKRIVYCLLCRCDVDDDHSDVIVTTDDYLWLKLSLVDPEISSNQGPELGQKPKTHDALSLSKLQNMLYAQYGEKHFNAWQQPLLYASVLFLTAQFECAIEFLNRIESLRCHAVHIALALFNNNLLALPAQSAAPLLSKADGDKGGIYKLNIVQLIRVYIRKFDLTNLTEALHYCFFLRNIKGTSADNMFVESLCEVILQSRDFNALLGVLNNDGSRLPGIVDKFKVDVCEVANVVARDSEKRGLHEDAIKLYDLAKNHEKSLTLLNGLLSQVIHLRSPSDATTTGSKRDRAIEIATAIALRYKTHGHNASLPNVSTLHLLLDVATFFDLYHQERFSDCVEVLKKLRIIALAKDEIDAKVNGVSSLGTELKAVLPHILLSAMNATYRLYQLPSADISSIRSPTPKSSISMLNMSSHVLPATKHLKEQARAIVTFAGMIPMRLNADVNARLVQLEALIN